MASLSTTPVPYTPSGVHFHSSLPSHLATELAFLHTFIRRAAAQHRTQLFLQRMEGTLRMGKILQVYLKGCSEKREGQIEDKWKHRGMCLVRKMIKSLYDAEFIVSQIVDLHHFLPLQTAALSIYARIFTVTLNLAGALGMDLEGLVSSAGSGKRTKSKKTRPGVPEDTPNGAVGGKSNAGKVEGRSLDFEIGEKIERFSVPLAAVKDSRKAANSQRDQLSSVRSPAPAFVVNSSTRAQPSQSPSPIPSPESPDSYPEPEMALNSMEVDINDFPAGSLLQPKKKKKRVDDEAAAPGVAAPSKKQRSKASEDHVTGTPPLLVPTVTNVSPESTVEAPKKKKKRVDEEGASSDKTKIKKKKKKDAMDDIFGF
ncbi:hypothetical protein I350_00592 [Cryptococcus amylolentus CBS 6273]|uniref:Uncharacterized protein n=1 Tax=Cryptococcus amylolentus CBS 6273 TaxID=1296118 RepID=A0A1E3KFD8_9TREE|nr:hypothetical protein I350_00592 [Cryptococcus amylolentus CBS 6273]